MGQNKKVSTYEKEALELLEDDENINKQVERGYRKAKNKVKTQISSLKYKKLDLQDQIDDAKADAHVAKVSIDFNLATYDNAVSNVESLEDQLIAIEATIENRKDLLKSWK